MSGYAYIWEFHVPAERRDEFERHYADGGTWVRLFRRVPGYVQTLLLRDRDMSERYVTIDRWIDESAYKAFRLNFGDEYRALDALCEGFTKREVALGTFDEIGVD